MFLFMPSQHSKCDVKDPRASFFIPNMCTAIKILENVLHVGLATAVEFVGTSGKRTEDFCRFRVKLPRLLV